MLALPPFVVRRCTAVAVWLFGAVPALAQDAPNHGVPRVIYQPAPPTVYVYRQGATVASANLHGWAAVTRARGEFLGDWATAWNIAEDAHRKALDNWSHRIDTYFGGRRKNQEYRAEERAALTKTPYERNQEMRRRILEDYQDVIQGDPSDEMNWLLIELYRLRTLGEPPVGSEDTSRMVLDKDILAHLWLTDDPSGANRWPADDGPEVEKCWPEWFHTPQWETLRQEFVDCCRAILDSAPEASSERAANRQKLLEIKDRLDEQIQREYTDRLHAADGPAPMEYVEAVTFRRWLNFEISRLVYGNSDGQQQAALRFQGTSILELIDHMGRQGLSFAPQNPADRGAYQTTFFKLQSLYNFYDGGSQPAP